MDGSPRERWCEIFITEFAAISTVLRKQLLFILQMDCRKTINKTCYMSALVFREKSDTKIWKKY